MLRRNPSQGISRSDSRAMLHQKGLGLPNPKIPSPRVPIEIVERIIDLIISDFTSPNWTMFSAIASCTLASSLLRQITLRQYVRDLLLETPKQWSGLYQMLSVQQNRYGNAGCFTWIRSLCASSTILSTEPQRLLSLTQLHQLSVDFSREGLATQHPRVKLIFKQLESTTVGTNLSSLTLSSLARIDVHLLRMIAASFPSLVDLYLSCTERLEVACCWICFEDSLSCILHSPIPDHYLAIEDLTIAFGDALKSLKNLTNLHLGIFLSDEDLLYSHIDHASHQDDKAFVLESSALCSICERITKSIRMRELTASLMIAQKLKALKSVGWSSFFDGATKIARNLVDCYDDGHSDDGNDCGDEGDDEELSIQEAMTTTIWIRRSNGRIKVRRTPWV